MADQSFRIWEGIYSSFSETQADGGAFEEEIWTNKLVDRMRAAELQSTGAVAIAPITEMRDYALPTVASLVASPRSTLRILDFGGGLASTYFQTLKVLPEGQLMKFVIVENETICSLGSRMLGSDGQLQFRTSLPKGEHFDIVHCGSSIEYVDDWKNMLVKLTGFEPSYLIFVNLPAADNLTFVTTQNYYGSRIPLWFFNFSEFTEQVSKLGYELAFKARFRGYWRENYPRMPTNNFPSAYRPEYFCQLVFRRMKQGE
jgi:putative methyltransferase (TIGR04325 family)